MITVTISRSDLRHEFHLSNEFQNKITIAAFRCFILFVRIFTGSTCSFGGKSQYSGDVCMTGYLIKISISRTSKPFDTMISGEIQSEVVSSGSIEDFDGRTA